MSGWKKEAEWGLDNGAGEWLVLIPEGRLSSLIPLQGDERELVLVMRELPAGAEGRL